MIKQTLGRVVTGRKLIVDFFKEKNTQLFDLYSFIYLLFLYLKGVLLAPIQTLLNPFNIYCYKIIKNKR